MDGLSGQHLEWLERQNTKSRNTIASRARVLRSVGNAATATPEDLDAWWEARAHLARGTRAVDLAHLRAFYRWCALYDHRLDDPSRRLEAPHVGNRIPRRARAHELAQLLDALPDDLRRAALLGAYAGMRVSEAAALDWADVDGDENTITIRASKRDGSRVVDVSPMLVDMLGTPVTGNVVTAGGEPYAAARLQRKLNRAIKATGLDLTTHSLRHRWGVAAYQASGDLLAVSEMMGHSSVNTTKIYAAASSDVKKKIAAAVMR
jgi:integrase